MHIYIAIKDINIVTQIGIINGILVVDFKYV